MTKEISNVLSVDVPLRRKVSKDNMSADLDRDMTDSAPQPTLLPVLQAEHFNCTSSHNYPTPRLYFNETQEQKRLLRKKTLTLKGKLLEIRVLSNQDNISNFRAL
jgi:hypothetical protein